MPTLTHPLGYKNHTHRYVLPGELSAATVMKLIVLGACPSGHANCVVSSYSTCEGLVIDWDAIDAWDDVWPDGEGNAETGPALWLTEEECEEYGTYDSFEDGCHVHGHSVRHLEEGAGHNDGSYLSNTSTTSANGCKAITGSTYYKFSTSSLKIVKPGESSIREMSDLASIDEQFSYAGWVKWCAAAASEYSEQWGTGHYHNFLFLAAGGGVKAADLGECLLGHTDCHRYTNTKCVTLTFSGAVNLDYSLTNDYDARIDVGVVTVAATDVSYSTAKLNGAHYGMSYVFFQWGITPGNLAYNTPIQEAPEITFSQILSPLYSGKTYYFRAVGIDSEGNYYYGEELSFTTTANPVYPDPIPPSFAILSPNYILVPKRKLIWR